MTTAEVDRFARASEAALTALQMVCGAIPKKIFKKNPEYWLKR